MRLVDLAGAQGGVFTRRQARESGLSAYRIARRVADGTWTSLYDGRVLCAVGTVMSVTAVSHAALLASSSEAVLAGPSAAGEHGIDVPWPRPVVLVPVGYRHGAAGITYLRDDVAVADVAELHGLRVTGRERTVVDCLLLLSEPAGRTFLDRALQQRWTDLDELTDRAGRRLGRHGVRKLRRHLEIASLGVRSEAERVLRRLLDEAGLEGWVADLAVPGIGILDFAFPSARLALEVDGRAWHSAGDRFQRDRTRQNALVADGWTVLRFTWEDLTQRPAEVVAAIRATLARLGAA